MANYIRMRDLGQLLLEILFNLEEKDKKLLNFKTVSVSDWSS